MEAQSNPHCLTCSSRVGVSNRNAVEIFNDQNLLPLSDNTLAKCISELTGKEIERETVHSLIICKKCYKLFQEYDELNYRVCEIKTEVLTQFKRSLQKNDLDFESYPDSKISKENEISLSLNNYVSNNNNSNLIDKTRVKNETSIEDLLSKSNFIKPNLLPDIKKMAPVPDKLIIVGSKGKKITIQNPNSQDSSKFSKEEPKKDNIGKVSLTNVSNAQRNLEPKKDNEDDTDDGMTTYLSEVDGMIIKTEKKDSERDIVFKELEIVDEDMPLEYTHILMENSEDGSLIRVVSGNNILQDEDGNLICTQDDAEIEAILPDHDDDDDDDDDIQVQYKGINLKDSLGNIIRLNPSKIQELFGKNETIYEEKDEENKNSVEGMDMDAEGLSIGDSMESQTITVKATNNLYTCLICEGSETERRSNENKMSDNDNDQTEEVENIFLGDAIMMKEHMKTMHDTDIFICDMCGEVYLSRELLQEHIDEHLKLEVRKCQICLKAFDSETMLKRHQKTSHGMENNEDTSRTTKQFCCPVCGKTFATRYTHQAHIKTHTDRPRPFTCMKCNKSFFTLQNLTQHEKTHLGIKNFICRICGKGFGTQHNLEVHGVVHTGQKPFQCKSCGKSFARRAEIRDHERIHTGEKPFTCEICGAKFSQRSNLQSHRRATHLNDKRYKCRLCEKCFKRRRLLDYHIKASHTGERPFRCLVCDATFVYPEHFKKHQRIHSGEKPYECEVCGKAFNSRDNRNAHRYVHSDKKPYECLHCGAGFMRKPLLYAHMHSQGHLNDTIVVNQPRLSGDPESTDDAKTTYIINSIREHNSNTIKDEPVSNFVHTKIPIGSPNQIKDEPAIITKIENNLTPDTYLEETENTIDEDMLCPQRIEIIGADEQELIPSEDGSVQIVQIKLVGGDNAWVALNKS